MKRIIVLIAAVVIGTCAAMAQDDPLANQLSSVVSMISNTDTAGKSAAAAVPAEPLPLWKQKLYYGYNFDIYFHHDSRADKKENGWSFSIEPELGWRFTDNLYAGMRLGGTFQSSYMTFTYTRVDGSTYTDDLRVMHGSWQVTPYGRYCLKRIFNDKVGIWLEAHLYAGMDYPRVMDNGNVTGTDYDGLRYNVTYGFQAAPVLTYQFSKSSSIQIFFSIMSFGYSGTTRCYQDASGKRHNEYSNDVIIFSGKLRNLIANQFTPALYGLKFGVQKSF